MDEKLRKFLAVANTGSFSKAAQQLRISQPALTMSIKKLERELGTELFVRHGRSFSRTKAGDIVYEQATVLAERDMNLRRTLTDLNAEGAPFRLGMIDSLAELLFLDNAFRSQMLSSQQNAVMVDNSRRLLQSVLDGQLDAVLVTAQPTYPPQLIVEPLTKEPLACVASPVFAKQYKKAPSMPYISYDEASSTTRWIDDVLDNARVPYKKVFHSTSPQIMLDLCKHGFGFTVVPKHMTATATSAQGLVSFLDEPGLRFERPIVYAYRRGAYQPKTIKTAMGRARQVFATAHADN